MSEITYSGLRFQNPSQPQKRQQHKTPRKKGPSEYTHEDRPAPSSSWKIFAVILGIICLMLLLSVGVLTTKLIQNSFNTEQCQGNNSSKNGTNGIVGKHPSCPHNWHQRGGNCYLFSRILFPWEQCSGYCSSLNSSFVKVETEEDMNFLLHLSKMQCELSQQIFFISLYYKNQKEKWIWLDGTPFTLVRVKIPKYKNFLNKCMYIKYGQLDAEDCRQSNHCICWKTAYL